VPARFLTVAEAARELGVLEYHARRALASDPDIPVIRLGRTRGLADAQLPRLRAALAAAGVPCRETEASCR
jgi:hypothetical protein